MLVTVVGDSSCSLCGHCSLYTALEMEWNGSESAQQNDGTTGDPGATDGIKSLKEDVASSEDAHLDETKPSRHLKRKRSDGEVEDDQPAIKNSENIFAFVIDQVASKRWLDSQW